IATADDDASDIADIHDDLLAVIASNLPTHQRVVVCRLFLGLRGLHGEVIQQHRLPSGRFKWRRHRFGVTAGYADIGAATAPLPEALHGNGHRRETESLKQLSTRDPASVEFTQQSGQCICHISSKSAEYVTAGHAISSIWDNSGTDV